MEAVARADLKEISRLLDEGADVNARNEYGMTALILASSKCVSNGGNAEVVMLLLSRGADTRAADKDGKTALTWAAERRKADAV